MNEGIRRAAIDAVSGVLERMFFVFAEAEEGQEKPGPGGKTLDPEPGTKWAWGEIGLQGGSPGTILLALPYPLAQSLAANFLGTEAKSLSEIEVLDAVSELNNMISGNLISRLDKKAKYSLTKPKTELISGEEKKERSPQTGLRIEFEADGQRMELNLLLPSME